MKTLPWLVAVIGMVSSSAFADISDSGTLVIGSSAAINGGANPNVTLDVNGSAMFGAGVTRSTFTPTGLLKLTANGIQWADGTTSTSSVVGGSITTNATLTGAGSPASPLGVASTGISSGTYGDSTHVAQCAFGADGRATSCSNIGISPGFGGASSSTFLVNETLNSGLNGADGVVLTGSTVTLTTTGGPVWLMANIYGEQSTYVFTYFNVYVDGAYPAPFSFASGGHAMTVSVGPSVALVGSFAFQRLLTGLSAGSHTFSLRAKQGAGTFTVYGYPGSGGSAASDFTVFELK